MAGIYTPGTSEILSGVYSIIQAAVNRVAASTRGIVAYPFVSNWGPTNALTTIGNDGDFNTTFNGGSTALSAAKIYTHAFKGKPKQVLGYRMATSAAAKGTVSLGASSLQLATLYPSDRAFTAVVRNGLGGTTIIDIVENSVKLVTVEDTTLAGLAAKLNASDYVRVTSQGTVLPAVTAGIAFAGGNNGSAATATEYAAFLDALEADGTANAFSLDAVTDDTIIATVTAWVARVRGDGIYITYVNGGPLSWDTDGGTAANTKSVALNSRAVVNVGNGCDGYCAAEMAIYVAARVASVALNATLTDETAPYTAVNKKLKPSQRKICKGKGTLVFIQNGDYVAIDEGINTLTAPGTGEKIDMGKIRINNTLDSVLKDLEAFGAEYKKDKSNTDEARQAYAATVEDSYFKPLARMSVLAADYFYRPDPDYHGKDAVYSPKLDEAFFYADITPVDSMERIYQKIGTHF